MSREKKSQRETQDYVGTGPDGVERDKLREEMIEAQRDMQLIVMEKRALDNQCGVLRQTLIEIASSLPNWRHAGIQAKVAEIQAIIRAALVRDAIATVDGSFAAKPICFVSPLAAQTNDDLGGDVHQAEAE
jgi:hypothetical protein